MYHLYCMYLYTVYSTILRQVSVNQAKKEEEEEEVVVEAYIPFLGEYFVIVSPSGGESILLLPSLHHFLLLFPSLYYYYYFFFFWSIFFHIYIASLVLEFSPFSLLLYLLLPCHRLNPSFHLNALYKVFVQRVSQGFPIWLLLDRGLLPASIGI